MKKYQKMISVASRDKIYHRDGCPYIDRIKGKNSLVVLKKEAKKMGYRPCKCCNSADFQYKHEQTVIKKYAKANHMELQRLRNHLFVKTEMGIWKIVYLKDVEKFILYHGNNGSYETPIREADKAYYHRQMDQKEVETVLELLKYIQCHDRYRRQVKEAGGNEMAVKVNKKYARQRTNRMRRQGMRRMDQLFAMVEKDHPEYRALTIF